MNMRPHPNFPCVCRLPTEAIAQAGSFSAGPSSSRRAGSVLPAVLIFSIIAIIMVTVFVSGQYKLARPSLMAPSGLQALCNARSGIWKAIELLNRGNTPDTLKGINTLDSLFNRDLFGKPNDTNAIGMETLVADSAPLALQPYSCDSFGTCEVALSYCGCFELLTSKGIFRSSEKNVLVKLGGTIVSSPDTAYYLETEAPLQGMIWGKGHHGPDSVIVRESDLHALVSEYTSELSQGTDTMVQNLPLTIQHNDEFAKIPDFVKGPLFIDGSHFDLSWKEKRRVTVLGDVQITGKVYIEGLELVAGGEIKCFDDCRLRDVTVFSLQRVVMSDRAVFRGTAIARTNMLLYGHAVVENRSMLIVTGGGKVASPPAGPIPPNGPARLPVFSITFTESSTIDATVVSLKGEGDLGIKIDKNAIVKGVLWTKGYMGLAGTLYGVIHAKALVNAEKALSGKEQITPDPILPGTASLRRIEDADKYYFPFFMGKLKIMQWQE